jgi:3-dehydroquinate synthetase
MTPSSPGWHVSHQRCVEYEILHCVNLLDPANDGLLSPGKTENARRFVVVDENVQRLHAAELKRYFDLRHVEARLVTFPSGEQNKSVDAYLGLLRELDSFPINRRDEPIIAIGGGVLTDLVGFVAGTYRRGVPHIKVPTTLIGYVDASVGIKTGVNLDRHKNRLGTFEPPLRVLLDKAFLQTLPRRHILNGVCEILKLAVIADRGLFELLEAHGADCIDSRFQDETGALILDRSIQGMIDELQPNLFEDNLARRMDFGHTFSYGLETSANSPLLHGEAVLIDVLISASLASGRGLLPPAEMDRILALVTGLGLILDWTAVEPCVLWAWLEERTLHRNGCQSIPLPEGIGNCGFVNYVTSDELQSAWGDLLSLRGG